MSEVPTTKPRRRWLRFSLRTLFVAVLVVGVGLGLVVRNVQKAERQRRAIEVLTKNGSYCHVSYGLDERGLQINEPRMPRWLVKLFGEDFFYSIKSIDGSKLAAFECLQCLSDLERLESVYFHNAPGKAIMPYVAGLAKAKFAEFSHCNLSDSDLEDLRGLVAMEALSLNDNPVTGVGLIHLGDSRHLRNLYATGTQFDDAGMRNLADLRSLEHLTVSGSDQLTDEGFKVLRSLTALKRLLVQGGRISESSLKCLQGMRQLESLGLDRNPNLGDAGLVHIERLVSLRGLNLTDCGVTNLGLTSIGRITNLEHLWLDSNPITSNGIVQLRGLSRLETLSLVGCSIDDSAVPELKRFPKLEGVFVSFGAFSKSAVKELAPIRIIGNN